MLFLTDFELLNDHVDKPHDTILKERMVRMNILLKGKVDQTACLFFSQCSASTRLNSHNLYLFKISLSPQQYTECKYQEIQ